MSELTCKCGHADWYHSKFGCARVGCACIVDFQVLHRAIVEAAMRYEEDGGGHDERALFAAIRALREAVR